MVYARWQLVSKLKHLLLGLKTSQEDTGHTNNKPQQFLLVILLIGNAKTKENASRFHLQPLFVVLSTIIACH